MNEKTMENCCSQRRREIHHSDLPLSCPTPEMTRWDGHPKVFLDVKTKGEVACPYCGTVYTLVE
jgi:uncharacterized Zn-finger protein